MPENTGKMPQSTSRHEGSTPPPGAGPAAATRALMRRALTASLATLEPNGHPYASLVLVATLADGSPVMLLSRLARHTRNMLQDARASLLFDGTAGSADPLTGSRVTALGRIEPAVREEARPRFLARHPQAQGYADFGDFAYYRLALEQAHFIGGFGRIVELPARDVLLDLTGADSVCAAEPEILAHMEQDHSDAIRLYATQLAGMPAGAWRMTGIDPEGVDLVADHLTARVTFDAPLQSPGDARRALAHLARAARGASPGAPEGLT